MTRVSDTSRTVAPRAGADPFAELRACQAVVRGATRVERVTETFGEVHGRLVGLLGRRRGQP